MKLTREYVGEELAIFWESPYGHGREKIASFWWPCHPPDKTHEVERAFEALADKLIAAPDSPVIPDSSLAEIYQIATRALAEPGTDTAKLTAICTLIEAAVPLRYRRLSKPAVADTRERKTPPLAHELTGSDPNFTGDLSTEEYVAEMRGSKVDTREREWRQPEPLRREFDAPRNHPGDLDERAQDDE